jgi:hypothetical protein
VGIVGIRAVPLSDAYIQARPAADNSNLCRPDDIEMAEVNSEGDPRETKQLRAHIGDSSDDYFEVEGIQNPKGPLGM